MYSNPNNIALTDKQHTKILESYYNDYMLMHYKIAITVLSKTEKYIVIEVLVPSGSTSKVRISNLGVAKLH